MFRKISAPFLNRSISARFFLSWRRGEIGGFTLDTPHLPHSPAYLAAQLDQFKGKNLPAKIVSLTKGCSLKGLDITTDVSFGSIGLFPLKTLAHLSPSEVTYLRNLGRTCYSSMADFELMEDVECIETQTEHGFPMYYIHHRKTVMTNQRPIDEIIEAAFLKSGLTP
ncbi:MAG: hypothetical protein ACOYKA_04330 [Legionellaceae bacterium]